jgi:hypothetical protein
MKKYFKVIDDKKYIKNKESIIVIKDDKAIYNPSEEMILNDGWEEYIEQEESSKENNPLLNKSIEVSKKIKEIKNYDSSEQINIFYIYGEKVWIDKATRVGLKLRFESELENGLEETTLWYEDKSYNLKINDAQRMLSAIELYASKCYDNTKKHIANVKNIENIEDIINYDFKIGYPEILHFH